jgi:GntR family transcriptional regulator
MQINITTHDKVPIYLQVVNQIKYQIAAGRLAAGEELPPIRVLAEKLVVNPNTIARAYRELELAGIVEKRRTAGTFVSDQGSPLARRERMKILTERIDQLLAEALQMDVSLDDVIKLLNQRSAVLSTSRSKESPDV